jgi:protein-disulfide isomerase
MFNTLYTNVLPTVESKYAGRLQLIFRQQIQPWHPSSTLVHESGAAVLKVNPDKFWEFSHKLFEKQTEFFDVNVVNETRNNTYKRLAKIAGETGLDEDIIYKLLEISDKPAADGSTNTGNQVTNDIKVMVKTNRLVGIHVTPTVVFNGVVENSISSSFSKDQWLEWLEKNIV